MGSDNLFHKRRERRKGEIARRSAKREAYDKVLIVCEGEKTEPQYFRELINAYELNTANVEICHDCGTDPVSIFKRAQQRYRESTDAGDPFDRVFCVFDKDNPDKYREAMERISNAKPKGVFQGIGSVPCFEYWFLLHFAPTTKPFTGVPGSSAGDQVVTELKKYLPGYEKGVGGHFQELEGQLDAAKAHAERTLREAERADTDNPTTRVHELVDYLQNLKKGS